MVAQASGQAAGYEEERGRALVSSLSALGYPMYVVPVGAVAKMGSFEPHEALLSRGDVVKWEPDLGDVIFFSHVWLSRKHPDPKGVQWHTLKAVFTSLSAGARKVNILWLHELTFGQIPSAQ